MPVALWPESCAGSEPAAFVIRNVLTPAECDALVVAAEAHGIEAGAKYVARTAKRTQRYVNADLSRTLEGRLRGLMEATLRGPPDDKENEAANRGEQDGVGDESNVDDRKKSQPSSSYMGPFHGIHTNWRVLRYDAESASAFPAHQDQMDSFQIRKPDGSKDLVVSSHTLLIQLSDDALEGGATRFYPRGTLSKARQHLPSFREAQFAHAVDVQLPRGWALVFRQKGLLHAGQPVAATSPRPKHVAQAGILRVLPAGVVLRPSVFRNAPGAVHAVFE